MQLNKCAPMGANVVLAYRRMILAEKNNKDIAALKNTELFAPYNNNNPDDLALTGVPRSNSFLKVFCTAYKFVRCPTKNQKDTKTECSSELINSFRTYGKYVFTTYDLPLIDNVDELSQKLYNLSEYVIIDPTLPFSVNDPKAIKQTDTSTVTLVVSANGKAQTSAVMHKLATKEFSVKCHVTAAGATPGLQAKLAALTKTGPRTDNVTTHDLRGDSISGKHDNDKVAKGQDVAAVKWPAGYREPGDIKSLEHINTILGLADRTGAESSKAYLDAVYAAYYETVLYHPCASTCVDGVDGAVLKAVNNILKDGSESFWTQIRDVHKKGARRPRCATQTQRGPAQVKRKRGRPKKSDSQPAAQGLARAAGRRAAKSETSARDDDDEEEEEEEDGALPAPAAAAEVARDAKPETLSEATKAVKEALGTVVKKAIDAGLKYYERQTDMDTVYKKLTTALSNYNKTECMNPPSTVIVQVNSSAMSTGETFTEHVQLLRDTTLVGRYKNCAMVLICDSARSHLRASFRKWCYHNDVTLLYVPAHGTSLLQPLDLTVIKSYRARLRQYDFLCALAGCLKDVCGVDVRRKGVSAAKMMSRMQAMLFAFKSMPAHFVIKGFSKMLGITDAELKEALNKSLRRK